MSPLLEGVALHLDLKESGPIYSWYATVLSNFPMSLSLAGVAWMFGGTQSSGRFLIDGGFLCATKGPAIFHGYQHSFVRRVHRLDKNRHNRGSNEKKHCQTGWKEKPEKRAVFHGTRKLLD